MIFPIYIVDNQTIYKHRLWFDVEQIQETTDIITYNSRLVLWFDVEQIQETTLAKIMKEKRLLWFDVEQIQETTPYLCISLQKGCGLM